NAGAPGRGVCSQRNSASSVVTRFILAPPCRRLAYNAQPNPPVRGRRRVCKKDSECYSFDAARYERLKEGSHLNAPAGGIGERPTTLQLGVILLVGVCGVMIAGLQPLLLGTLAQEGRITAAQLGHAATAELLLMGLASAYAGARWKAERLRAIGVISALVLAA